LAIGDSAGAAGAGIVHVNPGGALTASGPSLVNLYPGGTLDIAGGTVTAGSIFGQGGRVTWSSGTLALAISQTLDTPTFGSGISLGTPQTLTVTGALTVPSGQSLTLAGGAVSAGSFVGTGVYNLQTGNFIVTN